MKVDYPVEDTVTMVALCTTDQFNYNKLRVVRDSMGTAFRISRRGSSVLTPHRHRSHAPYSRFSHEPLVCAACDEPLLAAEHVLVSCCRYSGTRRRCRLSATHSEVQGDLETLLFKLLQFS